MNPKFASILLLVKINFALSAIANAGNESEINLTSEQMNEQKSFWGLDNLFEGEDRMTCTSYFLVVEWEPDRVVGKFTDLEYAKKFLMENYEANASRPQRLIAEVSDGKVGTDPHTVCGQNQGGGLKTGFNRRWDNWGPIHKMIGVAQNYVTNYQRKNYFLVVEWEPDRVVGKFTVLEYAKKFLMENYEANASRPQRLIAEVSDGKVGTDPHTVGGQNQGGGLKTGFNKYWHSWGPIHKMIGIAQNYVKNPSTTTVPTNPKKLPCLTRSYFLVVEWDHVVRKFTDLEDAKKFLMENYEANASRPQRLIAEVSDGKVYTDPHTVCGQFQGGGLKKGFNKYWHSWGPIHKMIGVAQNYVNNNQ